jgi:GDP-L-fucose synthase
MEHEANLIHGAHLSGVQRLMLLGSSCIYPRDCAQPMREEYLLTGPLEPTNEPYAIAKIAGISRAYADFAGSEPTLTDPTRWN